MLTVSGMQRNVNLESLESKPFDGTLFLYFLYFSCVFFNAEKRKFGYDAGYMKDEYGCNLSKCKCAPFDQTVIGKFDFFWPIVINRNHHSGDIAVSRKTVNKLMKISGDSNTAMWGAYAHSGVDLWDQNVVNGKYIIAYEINHGLDRQVQNLLPKVGLLKVMQKRADNFSQQSNQFRAVDPLWAVVFIV